MDAELNHTTGLVTWRVRSWDEATQDLPLEAMAGFLPVNDATGKGQGSVTFRVQPKADLASGTVINNAATITFDPTYEVNPPIRTATVRNTIDTLAPTSRVADLPADSPGHIAVSWSGSDPDGSDVGSYDIYVAVDRGPYLPWLRNTAQTAATFIGEIGRVYSFFSLARDRVGNIEAMKSAGEAQTRVTQPTPAYEAWLARYFSAAALADPALEGTMWGAAADPEGDGEANLVEYFLGFHPRQVDEVPALEARVAEGKLLVVFRQAKEATHVEVVVESSADLRNWSANGITVETIGDLGSVWLRRASVAVDGEVWKFIRLNLRRTGGP